MKLARYMKAEELSLRDFGGMVGVSHVTVSRWLCGSVPKPATMKRIVRRTKGKVQPGDFYGGAR